MITKYQEEVYIYRYDSGGSVWNLEATLFNPAARSSGVDPDQNDDFGYAVAVNDGTTERVFVGAWLEDSGGTDKGRVYFYEYNGSSWDLKQQITDGNSYDDYGFSVAVSGDGETLVVGARRQDSDTADPADHGVEDREAVAGQDAAVAFAADSEVNLVIATFDLTVRTDECSGVADGIAVLLDEAEQQIEAMLGCEIREGGDFWA